MLNVSIYSVKLDITYPFGLNKFKKINSLEIDFFFDSLGWKYEAVCRPLEETPASRMRLFHLNFVKSGFQVTFKFQGCRLVENVCRSFKTFQI